MFHRGCIMNWCNAEEVNVVSQMGFDEAYSAMRAQEKTNKCPICTMPINCNTFNTLEKVNNDALPLKGGRKQKYNTRKHKTRKYKTRKYKTRK